MALNDFYVLYTCKMCGCNMNEILLFDSFDVHVASRYKCTNQQCGIESEDLDEDFHNKVISKYIEKCNCI